MENSSLWIASTQKTHFPSLKASIEVEVAIIGGGITGISTALMLTEAGKEVAIFEGNFLAHGATGYTTAKVTSQHGLIYQDLIKGYGEASALQYAQASEAAIGKVQDMIHRYQIDCDYETVSSYVYSTTKKGREDLAKAYEVTQRLGLPSSIVEDLNLPFEAEAALRFTNQGMFHPRKYVLGMVEALTARGVSIYEHTRICEVKTGEGYELKTSEGQVIRAAKVVLATKYPILNKKGLYFAKLKVERSYAIAVISTKIKLDALYLNAEKPVRSLRPYKSGTDELTLIVGGNHPTGESKDTEKSYDEMIAFAKEMDPQVKIAYRWSTQDCMSPDHIPYIGESSQDLPGVFVATGFSKWGMTHGTVAAMLITDALSGVDNPWKEVFNPSRSMSLVATKELVSLGLETAGDLLHKMMPVKTKSIDKISNGEGQVIESNGKVIGVYKDETSKAHIVDPTCTHLGCRLTFNTAEKTWDCPCHGSRYTCEGKVIEAPAVIPLDTLERNE